MPEPPTPQGQPITRLALIATHIDGMVESAAEQYTQLQEARPQPWVLDDYTIRRVQESFTSQQGDLWLFDEQLRRWQAGPLTPSQRTEVARLVDQMRQLHATIAAILGLAEELSRGTIEKQWAKSDLQLGREQFLKGKPDTL